MIILVCSYFSGHRSLKLRKIDLHMIMAYLFKANSSPIFFLSFALFYLPFQTILHLHIRPTSAHQKSRPQSTSCQLLIEPLWRNNKTMTGDNKNYPRKCVKRKHDDIMSSLAAADTLVRWPQLFKRWMLTSFKILEVTPLYRAASNGDNKKVELQITGVNINQLCFQKNRAWGFYI